ncbi:GNAT family N-acetyltransferase [Parapedobacter tibetensis]|uniref:GNAT family N-acetyltransferase n=1 Tax=Parapedobacter tibetensis TaxID=2972951 RepID=UPI00214D73F4|nr:GNAT family N-acetyltransferase [Parapedobacter tibetensis]
MTIRPYHKNDWSVILDIFSRAKPDEFAGSIHQKDIIPLDKDDGLLNLFENSHLYVAVDENGVLGFIGYQRDLISFLFIDPNFYRHGIATRLLEFVLSIIGDRAWLLVVKTNSPAFALYVKHGFRVAEEFEGKYNERINVAVLRMAIKPELKSWI